jgi:hypothetical protein
MTRIARNSRQDAESYKDSSLEGGKVKRKDEDDQDDRDDGVTGDGGSAATSLQLEIIFSRLRNAIWSNLCTRTK